MRVLNIKLKASCCSQKAIKMKTEHGKNRVNARAFQKFQPEFSRHECDEKRKVLIIKILHLMEMIVDRFSQSRK